LTVEVSVVVPVFDPGPDIDQCVRSVLGQSLAPDRYEAIFVDDGSTDGTASKLDRLAHAVPQVSVIHIPNSGWPGRPRNLGTDRARGEYVLYLDQDDHLAPEALERMAELGRRNRADIVIGRETSDFRTVPLRLFDRDRDRCTIEDAPLMDSMTPHKMFRRAFLVENGLRFPEGRFYLEDYLLVTQAYLRADAVSILASYPCYFYYRRRTGANAASGRLDEPEVYFDHLRQVVDLVVEGTAPGELRDRWLRRLYRYEVLAWVSEPFFLELEESSRDLLVTACRPLALAAFGGAVETGLRPVERLRSALLKAGSTDGLADLARTVQAIEGTASVKSAFWSRGRLEMELEGALGRPSGGPLVVQADGRSFLAGTMVDTSGWAIDGTADPTAYSAVVSIRQPDTLIEWRARATARTQLTSAVADGGAIGMRPILQVRAWIDPAAGASGGPLPEGDWEIRARLLGLGIDRRLNVGASTEGDVQAKPAWLGDPPRIAIPTIDATGGLRLSVRPPEYLAHLLDGRSMEWLPGGGRHLAAELPLASRGPVAPFDVRVLLSGPAGSREIPAQIVVVRGRPRLVVQVGLLRARLPRGVHDMRLCVGDRPGPAIGRAETIRDGRTFAVGAPRQTLMRAAASQAGRAVRGVVRRARRRRPRPPSTTASTP